MALFVGKRNISRAITSLGPQWAQRARAGRVANRLSGKRGPCARSLPAQTLISAPGTGVPPNTTTTCTLATACFASTIAPVCGPLDGTRSLAWSALKGRGRLASPWPGLRHFDFTPPSSQRPPFSKTTSALPPRIAPGPRSLRLPSPIDNTTWEKPARRSRTNRAGHVRRILSACPRQRALGQRSDPSRASRGPGTRPPRRSAPCVLGGEAKCQVWVDSACLVCFRRFTSCHTACYSRFLIATRHPTARQPSTGPFQTI